MIGEHAMTILAIAIAIGLMTIVPLATMANKKDDIAMLEAQAATEDMVATIATTGSITQDMYDDYVKTLASTGRAYDIEMTIKVNDEDPSKKEVTLSGNIGEGSNYEVYTSQILDVLNKDGSWTLNKGDKISITSTTVDKSLASNLQNLFISITGKNINRNKAQASRMVP